MPSLTRMAARLLPGAIKRGILKNAPKRALAGQRHGAELSFWEDWVREHGTAPETSYYQKFMLDMGNVKDVSLFDGKICIDIGCGPRGSLTWLKQAKAAIGVDPLSEAYARFGISEHEMIYLSCPAEKLPFPSQTVDVVFSMNSLDHVEDFKKVCAEIRRVLKPGGYFIASLNLDEPPSLTEPWTLTEDLLDRHLFAGWKKEYYEIRPKPNDPSPFGPYKYFYEPCPPEAFKAGEPRALWCRFRA